MGIFKKEMLAKALVEALKGLNPFVLCRNVVMFVVEIGSIITSVCCVMDIVAGRSYSFTLQISIWLWLTVLFATFAEAIAELHGKARAQSLRSTQSELKAERRIGKGGTETVAATELRRGDVILVREGEVIPGDGEITEGAALIDEAAITGESAPVIRQPGGDRSGVTGGTRLLSGSITVRVTANPGETFLDQMIAMVENAKRQKTPNERALNVLLIGLTVLFIAVCGTLPFYGQYMGIVITVTVLIALLVCLMPTTIGALLPAIGIAGMDRLLSHNVLAFSGRAVEAAGDVNIILLDKTGTLTIGNRMATEFVPAASIQMYDLVEAALYSSLSDETPEGRSIVQLAKKQLNIKSDGVRDAEKAVFVPFTPESRMSGVNIGKRMIRKGAWSAIGEFVMQHGGTLPSDAKEAVDRIARAGGTPLAVAENGKLLGIVHLKDIVKEGIKPRLAQLRSMGIKSVMITGDNPLTAASIAAETGVDDFLAEAKPADKLEIIRKYQAEGNLVAMIGDGTNDSPALAQADVAVAMHAGTQAAREAANMVDLDSSPTKLLDVVEIGKEILITRGTLTTFSIANDVAKYFAIIPAMFAVAFPGLAVFNVMRLASPQSAILSAVIFNAIVIPALIPLALRGVKYRSSSASRLLLLNLLIYGVGGLILPFVGIKAIDMVVASLSLT